MNIVEFKRLMRLVPGTTVKEITVKGNRVFVVLKFKWYARPLAKAIIHFLVEIFSYLHVAGTIIYFYDYKEIKKSRRR